jgi:hypothetical protein
MAYLPYEKRDKVKTVFVLVIHSFFRATTSQRSRQARHPYFPLRADSGQQKTEGKHGFLVS